MPARFISRVTGVGGTKRFVRIDEKQRDGDGDGADARVRVISALGGGDGDGSEVFEEEFVAVDEQIIIHFDDNDRVSRIQDRFRNHEWLDRARGSIEADAYVVHVGEARIERRSKILNWAARPEDDRENVYV